MQCKFGKGTFVGHCLTSYALQPFFDLEDKEKVNKEKEKLEVNMKIGSKEIVKENKEEDVESSLIAGGWRHVLEESVNSTRITFPVCVYVYLIMTYSYNYTNKIIK